MSHPWLQTVRLIIIIVSCKCLLSCGCPNVWYAPLTTGWHEHRTSRGPSSGSSLLARHDQEYFSPLSAALKVHSSKAFTPCLDGSACT